MRTLVSKDPAIARNPAEVAGSSLRAHRFAEPVLLFPVDSDRFQEGVRV